MLNLTCRQRSRWLWFAALVAALVFVLTIQDFLAISRPVVGNILVVEAWIWNSSAIKEAADEFARGHYEWLVTIGEPIEEERTPDRSNTAVLAAKKLQDLGIDKDCIIMLIIPNASQHRTYLSALTLKKWLMESRIHLTGVNVFTLGPHARKSLVLFERALGPEVKVGVIAGTDDSYAANCWWISPRGIYVIVRKLLGYIYAVTWPFPDSLPLFAP